MPWAVAAAAVGVIGGAVIGNQQQNAAEDAAAAQQQSAADAQAESRRQFDLTRADTAPYREAGVASLNDLRAGLGPNGEFNRQFTMSDFQADPGYQFRLQQGEQALNRSIAARSGVLSGGAVKAGMQFNSGLASQEYGAAWDRFQNERTGKFNRLATVAGIGQTGLNAANQAGQNNVSNQIDAMYGSANAAGALAGARANNTAGIVNGIGSAFNNYAAYRQYGGAGGGGGAAPAYQSNSAMYDYNNFAGFGP